MNEPFERRLHHDPRTMCTECCFPAVMISDIHTFHAIQVFNLSVRSASQTMSSTVDCACLPLILLQRSNRKKKKKGCV